MPTPLDRPFRLGTRGSPLALAQAHLAAEALRTVHGWGEADVEIVPITTTGDAIQDRPLAEIGGKALWTKELDRALLDGRTDASVHSMKDVETVRPDSLLIAACLPRADTADRLIGADSIDAIPHGATIGTSSPRRRAQLLARRPDLNVVPIRGNVQTRLSKVGDEVDVTILAAAGLDRLGMGDIGVPASLLSAPGQGAVGLEVLAANAPVRAFVEAVNHGPTAQAVAAERAFLAAIGGDCHSAVACLVEPDGLALTMAAEILSIDGREVHEARELLYDDASGYLAPMDVANDLLNRASPALRAMFAS